MLQKGKNCRGVLRRQFGFKQGDPYDRSVSDETRNNIDGLGVAVDDHGPRRQRRGRHGAAAEHGRRRPRLRPGRAAGRDLAVSRAAIASALAAALPGVQVEDGRVVVDADGATGRPGVYAAGDCANGGKEVVNATAEGKRAALAIDRRLMDRALHGGVRNG